MHPSSRSLRARSQRAGAALAFVAMLMLALSVARSAGAAFPGSNGKIAFERNGQIYVMAADGSGQTNLSAATASESEPAWSPDGSKGRSKN